MENYDLISIVEKCYHKYNEKIYKEDVDLVKAILTLRKECPQSYKSTAITKILAGKSTKFQSHQYFGFIQNNPKWNKKVVDEWNVRKPFYNALTFELLMPLETYQEPSDEEREEFYQGEYIGVDYKVDKMQVMLLDRSIKKLYEKYPEHDTVTDKLQLNLPPVSVKDMINKHDLLTILQNEFIKFVHTKTPNAKLTSEIKPLKDCDNSYALEIDGKQIEFHVEKIKCAPETRTCLCTSSAVKFKNDNTLAFHKISITFDKDFNVCEVKPKLSTTYEIADACNFTEKYFSYVEKNGWSWCVKTKERPTNPVEDSYGEFEDFHIKINFGPIPDYNKDLQIEAFKVQTYSLD